MCGSKKWIDTGARRKGSNICCEVEIKKSDWLKDLFTLLFKLI